MSKTQDRINEILARRMQQASEGYLKYANDGLRKSVEKMRAQREQRLDDNITDYYKVLAIKMAQGKKLILPL